MFLVIASGPQNGQKINLSEKDEWIIGKDPSIANLVLEDNSLDRKHAQIRKTDLGYVIKNFSSHLPVEVNENVIDEYLLSDKDVLLVGDTVLQFFENEDEFKEENPDQEKFPESVEPVVNIEETSPSYENEETADQPTIYEPLASTEEASEEKKQEPAYILKVISGPNSGAEFAMEKNHSYILGKDPDLCDIIFNDLSVSKKHAKIEVDDLGEIYIEDLESKNKILIDGLIVSRKTKAPLKSLITVGTSSFIVVDQASAEETIYTPTFEAEAPKIDEEKKSLEEAVFWKKKIIPFNYLIAAGTIAVAVLFSVMSFFGLFVAKPVQLAHKDPSDILKKTLAKYESLRFVYNDNTKELFLAGHVLTAVDKQELLYILDQLDFVQNIEDSVVIDELVWKNYNDLLAENDAWRSVSIHSLIPGQFIITGYVDSMEDAAAVLEYLNANFPYLDKLENRLAVEEVLKAEIASQLAFNGFSGITFKLSGTELVLDGRYDGKKESQYDAFLKELKKMRGVSSVKNIALSASSEQARIDLSTKYAITGYAQIDDKNFSIVANGKIVAIGDLLDGLKVTNITANTILLEKDGIKYKIRYSR